MPKNIRNNTTSLQEAIEILKTKAVGSGIDTSDATATSADILSDKTAYANGEKITGSIPLQSAKIITPSTSEQVAISSGYYASGEITVQGDANLTAENIKKGAAIFGVEGSYEGEGGSEGEGGDAQDIETQILEKTIVEYYNSAVTTISPYAFFDCKSLISVSFPSCKIIASNAFLSCSNLMNINFPLCTTIDTYAFKSCFSLTTAVFPMCTTIGNSAFQECRSLTIADFPSCTCIGIDAFGSCKSLTTANFPSCTRIDANAFQSCSSLTTVNFSNCAYIGARAFGFARLPDVTFPVCTAIGGNAFAHLRGSNKIELPICTTIGFSAFSACDASIVALGSGIASDKKYQAVFQGSGMFYQTRNMALKLYYNHVAIMEGLPNIADKMAIYVPASLVDAYKSATNWATYADRITAIPEE